ncbi:MAG: 3-deoxy-manno-octulosonate cytidylyltransferase [Prevotellaceae bacterium]|jgi:3-deoxy-manno-octulosonate cytidylyltransferase (CMP-KDO synthetase)|nr:3-deoxy-manno-octulosonate cytidylyltransferase [Prevotellaceae bacterium]
MFTNFNKNILIIIPARYESSRLPGKPLMKIKGVEMLKRVAGIAQYICQTNENCGYCVATDDDRIMQFCGANGINAAMTSKNCRNGTERCCDLISGLPVSPKLVINLQGDNPLCPPWIIQEIIDEWRKTVADVYTPVIALNWDEYDRLSADKQETPFSGTTVIADKNGFALAFSKNIIPAVRKPAKARKTMMLSPIMRHIGLYAYTVQTLDQYSSLAESPYENDCIEGLEQMRFLYNGLKIKLVTTNYRGRETCSGVDSVQDIERVEKIIDKFGEFDIIE